MALAISGLAITSQNFLGLNAQSYLDAIDIALESVGWHCPSNNHNDCKNDPTKKLIYATGVLTLLAGFGGPSGGDVIVYGTTRIGIWDGHTAPPNYPSGADVWITFGADDTATMQNYQGVLPAPNLLSTDGSGIHITILPAAHITNGIALGNSQSGHLTWDQPYTHGGGYTLWSLPMIGTLAQIQVQMTVTNYFTSQVAFVFSDASDLIGFSSAIFSPRIGMGQIICSGWQFFIFLSNDTAAGCSLLVSLPARDLTLGKLIVAIGSEDGSGQNLRAGLYAVGKYWIKNGSNSNTVIPPSQDPRTMEFCLPTIGSQAPVNTSLMGQAILTSDDGAVPAEPFVAVSLDGVAKAQIIGSLWDTYLLSKSGTLDQSGAIAGRNSQCVGSDPGSTTRTTGSLWMLVP